jgi:dTDP-4-amino-4,6-dideoxygalactose transaminase
MSEVPFFTLQRQHDSIRRELDQAIGAVLDQGSFVLGSAVTAFEQSFAAWCGVSHAVGVGSGTDAVELALRAVGVGRGDEVITAAATCVPTIAAIEATGAEPVLADIDEGTRTLDPALVETLITERTRALLPVHLYGLCADVDALVELAAPRGIRVVEDAAQAHGARLRGRPAGSLADAAAFSFYPTKNLGALGDAGVVVTGDPEIAERVRMLRSYGERTRYVSELHGRNSRLDELQAAVLTVKLGYVDDWNARRRELASYYTDGLANTALGLPADLPDGGHAWHLYVVRSSKRDELKARLADEGIGTLIHYPRAVHEHPAYRALAHSGLGRSETLSAEALSLPLYPELTDLEAERVVEAVAKLAG